MPAFSCVEQRKVVHVPTGEEEEEEDKLGTTDFAVTRDFSLLKGTMFPLSSVDPGNVQPKVRKKHVELDAALSSESNLHELGM